MNYKLDIENEQFIPLTNEEKLEHDVLFSLGVPLMYSEYEEILKERFQDKEKRDSINKIVWKTLDSIDDIDYIEEMISSYLESKTPGSYDIESEDPEHSIDNEGEESDGLFINWQHGDVYVFRYLTHLIEMRGSYNKRDNTAVIGTFYFDFDRLRDVKVINMKDIGEDDLGEKIANAITDFIKEEIKEEDN